ncbi:MAG: hypothetical protein AAGG68_11920 [Bacteroidota bacterium]
MCFQKSAQQSLRAYRSGDTIEIEIMAFNYWQKFEEKGIYHIYNHSVSDKSLFQEESDYEFFLEKVELYLLPYLDVYAYCLMPNHFHLLAKIRRYNQEIVNLLQKENTKAARKFLEVGNTHYNNFLEDQMRRLFSSHALKYKGKYGNDGALFQQRFKRVKILSETIILNKIAYVHHNPIHHNFAAVYEDWKYSSYNAFLSEKTSKIARMEILNWLGDGDVRLGKQIFKEFHESYKLESGENWQIDFDNW